MTRLGVRIDPDRPAEGLSIADQQIIEIAKAISLDARVLIMDEPTAALSGVEVDRLFAVARSLRDEGRALMFISHRFDEVFALCDTVTVMRDGTYISTDAIADTSVAEIVRRMVGRDVNELFPKQDAADRPPAARGRRTSPSPASSTTSASPSAPARSSPSPAWSAPDAARWPAPSSASTRTPAGRSGSTASGCCADATRSAAMKAGLALVPEDRRKQGLVIDATVASNITDAIRPTR